MQAVQTFNQMLANQLLVSDFYIHHNVWLHSWLRKKVGCNTDAADLMHDTYVKLMLKEDLNVITEPRAYLTTIAHALMVNHLRRNKIEQACLSAISSLPDSAMPSPETLAITIETLVKIDAMLDGLAPKARRAFLWCQLEGISHAEIAARLGVSVSSVRKYIANALLHCIALQAAD